MPQLACRECQIALTYPQGAPSVRCPMCSAVTNVQQFQVACDSCRSVLLLPMNTTLAMCPRCRTVMSIPPSIADQGAPQAGPPNASVDNELQGETVVLVDKDDPNGKADACEAHGNLK